MRYDPALIELKEETINGQKIKIQVIPSGMCGPNGPILTSNDVFDNSEEDKDNIYNKISKNESLLKEYTDYVNEGIEPDSDEINEIKDKIEKSYVCQELDEFEWS